MADPKKSSLSLPPESGVLKQAGAMGAATFVSRILGLGREQAFAILFGAGPAMDAFAVAFRIPNLLRDLFAEGAMSSALVPVFVGAREKKGLQHAWRIAGLVFRAIFVVVCTIALVGGYFADDLVSLYAHSFRDVPGKYELTVFLTRILFPYFPLVALAAAFMGVLNAVGAFFLPGLASAIFNLASIVSGIALTFIVPRWGLPPISGMAFGVLLGGLAQAFSQYPVLRKKGYRFPKRLQGEPVWYREPALKKMLWLMIPGMFGMAATQINILVNTVLATSEGTGAVSWLQYAFRLMQLPIGLFGVSLAVATLPAVSAKWANQDVKGFEDLLSRSMRQVMALSFPAAFGLAALAWPIIALIFEYGRFDSHDTVMTASALAAYAVGLPAYSLVKILVPAFYGMGTTRVPVLSSALSVGANIILNLIFVRWLGFWGLALGTSLAAVLNASFLIVMMRRHLARCSVNLSFAKFFKALASNLLAAALMGTICFYLSQGLAENLGPWITHHLPGTWGLFVLRLTIVGSGITVGVVVVWGLAKLLGIEEMNAAISMVLRKLRRVRRT